jgi:CHAD domain-containing protein
MSGELERVRKALRELGKSLESVPGDLAPENVHKLRTSSRRVEAIATVLEFAAQKKSRRLVKSIAPLRKAAGGVRDMDVLAANARKLARYCAGESLTHLLAHLDTAREQNARELQHAMHRRRKAALEALKHCSRLVQSALKREKSRRAKSSARSITATNQSQEKIHSAAMHIVRELSDVKPLDAHNLHEFRLNVKNLRYTLQLDEDADPGLMVALGDVQRRIGDWHDWQQLEETAREVLVLEQDQSLLDRIDRTARRRLEAALSAANTLRAKYLVMPLANGI